MAGLSIGNILSAVKLAALLGLVAALLWYRHEAHTERKARIVAQHSIEAIKGAQRASLALETARNARVKAEQARINEDAAQAYRARIADLRSRYGRLLAQGAGSAPGDRQVPGVSDAAGIVDGTPGDNGLLTVLQAADEQTARLIELQNWARRQAAVDPNPMH